MEAGGTFEKVKATSLPVGGALAKKSGRGWRRTPGPRGESEGHYRRGADQGVVGRRRPARSALPKGPDLHGVISAAKVLRAATLEIAHAVAGHQAFGL